MTIINTKKTICCKCSKRARLYYKKKWWCSIESDFGTMNMTGYCKNVKKK